jgi:tetratricopeptide (TPR) repeat protein
MNVRRSSARSRSVSDTPRQGSEHDGDARPRHGWLVLIVIAAGLAAYGGSFGGPFIFDDVDSITNNPYIRRLWPPSYLWSAPLRSTVAGRPVVGLSLAVNYALGGLDVRGYHVFNLVAHLLCAALLFGLVRRTLRQAVFEQRREHPGDWLAAAVALIWVVHPLLTESVTYVIQRTELLMALFCLLTLYCAIRGWRSNRRFVWFSAAVLACALGIASKEAAVVAPLLVLLYERTFVTPSFAGALRRHGGLYAGLAASWILLGVLMAASPRGETAGFGLGVSALAYLQTQAQVILWYLRLCFWPAPLSVAYDWPIAAAFTEYAAQGLAVLALVGAALVGLWRRHWTGFLGAWFFLTLAPTSSVVPIVSEVVAERRMYLPLASVVVLAVTAGWWGLAQLGRRSPSARPVLRGLGVVGVLALAAGLGAVTAQRNRAYRSVEAIWRDTVAKYPQDDRARTNLAMALLQAGRLDDAIAECRAALRLNPGNYITHNALGFALSQQGAPREAVAHCLTAVRLNPGYYQAHNNLANALQALGRYEEALQHYNEALSLWPDYAPAHGSLGYALAQTGRLDEAIGHYRRALELAPGNVLCLNNLGNALARRNQHEQAIEVLRRALAIDPHSASTYNNLASALASSGDLAAGVEYYQKALELAPDSLSAHYNLARTYQQMRRSEAARTHYRRALDLARGAGNVRLAEMIQSQLAGLEP